MLSFNLINKLWFRLSCLLLILVTVPLVIMGRSLVMVSDSSIEESVEENYVQIAKRAAREISMFVERPRELLLASTSVLSVIGDDAWRQETVLVDMALNYSFMMRISLFDIAGNETVTSALGDLGTFKLEQTVRDEIVEDDVYISSIEFSEDNIPYLVIALALKEQHKIIGFLAAHINVRGMWDIVDSIRLGESGRAFLVSESGIVLAHYDKKNVLKNIDMASRRDVRSVIIGLSGTYDYSDSLGERWLTSYAPLRTLGWGLVIEQKSSEAYKASAVMQSNADKIVWVSMFLALLASIFFACFLARPVKKLSARFKMLSMGVFDTIPKVSRKDELGDLLRSFNETATKLDTLRDRERRALVGDASAWIAHELKNSLASIKTFVQLFPRKHDDEKFIERFIDLVPDELSRFERLLKQFADYSHDAEDLQITRFSLNNFVLSISGLLEESFKEKNAKIASELPVEELMMNGDVDRLRQVFLNLYLNALKAMPDGGFLKIVVKSFVIGEVMDAPWVEVRISDTGKGIEPERIETIFKPFHTSGDRHKDGSMGLGLPICRRIVEQHGGSIRVESVLGEGTVFIIFMPLFICSMDKNQ